MTNFDRVKGYYRVFDEKNRLVNSGSGKLEYKYIDVEPRNYQDYMIYGPVPYSEMLKWSNLMQNNGWK